MKSFKLEPNGEVVRTECKMNGKTIEALVDNDRDMFLKYGYCWVCTEDIWRIVESRDSLGMPLSMTTSRILCTKCNYHHNITLNSKEINNYKFLE